MEFSQYEVNALLSVTKRPDVVYTRGEGMWLFDHTGKRYLDFMQGWAVNCLGHASPCITEALTEQSKKLINPSPAFYNEPAIELAALLKKNSCFDRVFFASSGAEANEGAIKLARKYHVGAVRDGQQGVDFILRELHLRGSCLIDGRRQLSSPACRRGRRKKSHRVGLWLRVH